MLAMLTRPVDRTPLLPAHTEAMGSVPHVLFVCVHNAGRSVAARVLLDHYANGWVIARSAGSAPAEHINPAVAEVLRERGLDLSGEQPTRLEHEAAQAADVIVTMGCGDECPYVPGSFRLDWKIPDPAGKSVEGVRPIVEEIDAHVRDLLAAVLRARATTR